MKIVNPAAFALVCILAHTSGASAKKSFEPKDHSGSGSGKSGHMKTAADFDGTGAVMKVCPTGDCTAGKFMKLAVASLTELTAAGDEVGHIDKFKPKNSDWTDVVEKDVNGATVYSTTFVTTLEENGALFNLTADIYPVTTAVSYGSQNLTVPAGSLKFTVDIANWPFDDDANTLTLAVTLDAKGPKGGKLGKPKKKAKGSDSGSSDASDVERVDMGDSMFMDTPTYAMVDGVETPLVNSSVVDTAGDTEFQWVFTSFKETLHYDPVLGDSSTGNTTTTSTSSSSSGATTTTSTSSASVMSLSSLAAGALAAIAYSLF
ncbi:hypothetical protein PHYSODRAFT_248889 [Phytophthora sojae]|uniref:Uncharacterized protein n=1 Tax=Phytophthora sojae (strain P6497) TaxID=1094619 RepID=G4ZY00_PHYSP|nr:hypothetical protein PHYSODRAFT_248889 [Phytophthora sojae]EGZ12660.1 hypothetical protein PHYSODRAFT_248889 [Phytophthora sojae]|eukprot:XP_009532993.1 hypothetical protein PHYSODRAFT_248889 [Phytophthora sojae]